jgi:hypothetical protein
MVTGQMTFPRTSRHQEVWCDLGHRQAEIYLPKVKGIPDAPHSPYGLIEAETLDLWEHTQLWLLKGTALCPV